MIALTQCKNCPLLTSLFSCTAMWSTFDCKRYRVFKIVLPFSYIHSCIRGNWISWYSLEGYKILEFDRSFCGVGSLPYPSYYVTGPQLIRPCSKERPFLHLEWQTSAWGGVKAYWISLLKRILSGLKNSVII